MIKTFMAALIAATISTNAMAIDVDNASLLLQPMMTESTVIQTLNAKPLRGQILTCGTSERWQCKIWTYRQGNTYLHIFFEWYDEMSVWVVSSWQIK